MDFQKSRLDRIKRSLYSRNEKAIPKDIRPSMPDRPYDVANNWGAPPSFALPDDAMNKNKNSFFNKFLIGSVLFFLGALGVASYIFFGGLNTISSNNVDMKILAPSSVSSGEEFDMNLSIVNGNHTTLTKAVLYIDYPDGAQSVDKSGVPLAREKVDLGTIGGGQSKDHAIRALFFGEKGAVKTISLELDYSVTGSNATFSKKKTYDVTIGSSPLLLNVTAPEQITSGDTITLSIDVTSNSSVVVQNAYVKIAYPYGFTFKDSNIKAVKSDNTIWSIGDLKNGDKKTIRITGTLVGQNMEDRSFQVSVGTPDKPKTVGGTPAKDFTTSLATDQATVAINKSFFDLSAGTNDGNTNIGHIGENNTMVIGWDNTLSERIVNGSITATLSGNVFDPSKVSPGDNGFYRSGNSTVSWDKNSTNKLADLSPGENGQVSFSFTSLSNPAQVRSIKNPHIDVHVAMTGNRTSSDTTDVTSVADVTVKFVSDLQLSTRSYRYAGPFTNTGPIPPKADTESTYTITWVMTNTTNDLKDTTVTAVLPAGVAWKSQTSPSGEHISYNPDTRTVVWNVGNVSAGTGFVSSARTTSFQVGITPSQTQVGNTSLNLVTDVSAQATDTYTGSTITISSGTAGLHFADPGFKTGDDSIVK